MERLLNFILFGVFGLSNYGMRLNDNPLRFSISKWQVAEFTGLDMRKNIISAYGPLAIGTMQDIAFILAF